MLKRLVKQRNGRIKKKNRRILSENGRLEKNKKNIRFLAKTESWNLCSNTGR